METLLSAQTFSVDFLLGQVAASTAIQCEPTADEHQRLVQIATEVEAIAQQHNDTGNTLVAEVEAYLADAAESIAYTSEVIRQLGDTCLDHTTEHALAEESAESDSGHTHNHSGHGQSHSHENHAHSTIEIGKKRKSKKRQRNSLLSLYIQQLKRKTR